jgi:hypothetical protein
MRSDRSTERAESTERTQSTERTGNADRTPAAPPPAARRSRRGARLAVGAVAVVTCGLLTGGVAYAHSGTDGSQGTGERTEHRYRAHGARGTVASIDGTTFVLTARDGSAVTVATIDTTTFSTAALATLADAPVGAFVVVHGKTAEDGTVSARVINVKPTPATATGAHWRHGVAGTVASNDPATGVLTITTEEGVVTANTTTDTKVTKTTALTLADLTVGAKVGVHGTFGDDGTLTATRVKVLPANVVEPVLTDPAPVPTSPIVAETTTTVAGSTEQPPTTTAPPSDEVWQGGTVATVDGASFTITTRDGATLVVTTDASTVFTTGGGRGDSGDDDDVPATIAAVVVGAQVKVTGTLAADGTLAASSVSLCGWGDGGRDGWRENRDDDSERQDASWTGGEGGDGERWDGRGDGRHGRGDS